MRVLIVWHHRREIAATAPPRLRRHEMTCVHVHCRDMRVLHVCDKGDAARPETRIGLRAGDGLGEFRRQRAVDAGGCHHADLLEHAAAAQRADHAAVALGTLPGLAGEPSGREMGERAGILVFDLLEFGADAIAQLLEPGACANLAVCQGVMPRHAGNPFVCLNASPSTIAPASATLRERRPSRKGMQSRASAVAWTSSGTPALSRPSRSVSSGRNKKAL